MKAKVYILIFLTLQTFHLIGQNINAQSNKKIEKENSKQLDSVFTEIKTFKDQFNHIENFMWFTIQSDTIIDSLGNYGIGNKIFEPHGDFNGRKIGIWTEYYANNSVKSIGCFGIGAFTWCQAIGPTITGYSFKTGEWKFYYSNGQLKAKGVVRLEPEKFQNSCSGDAWYLSKIDEKWEIYDESGNRIKATKEIIKEIEGN